MICLGLICLFPEFYEFSYHPCSRVLLLEAEYADSSEFFVSDELRIFEYFQMLICRCVVESRSSRYLGNVELADFS